MGCSLSTDTDTTVRLGVVPECWQPPATVAPDPGDADSTDFEAFCSGRTTVRLSLPSDSQQEKNVWSTTIAVDPAGKPHGDQVPGPRPAVLATASAIFWWQWIRRSRDM
jgi:hypothetical protein